MITPQVIYYFDTTLCYKGGSFMKDVSERVNGNAETIVTAIPLKPEDVTPLDYQTALANFSEQEQQEILELSRSIDIRKIDHVMHYGDTVLKATFDQCGAFLKNERGSQADQEVIAQVIQLSKRASSSYDDFTLTLKEPNVFQKIFLKISTGGKVSHTQKVQESAVTNYQLLLELRNSCDSWLEMLREAMGEISNSAMSDVETASLLEKYIIAGKLAEERIEKEMAESLSRYQQTGLQRYAQEYDDMQEGYDLFAVKMNNLEKSRVMYRLSFGQLALIKRSNRNVQISIHTQVSNSMALMGQQLRNAVLNAKTREVLKGQKAINRLNNELIRDVSKNIGLTAEETEKLMYEGFYDVEAAKAAITAVIHSCQAIQKTAEEMLPKMKADMSQLGGLVEELEPYIDAVKRLENRESVSDDSISKEKQTLSF